MNNHSFGARRFRIGLAIALSTALVLGTAVGASADSKRPWRRPHHLKHIFHIVLENYKAEDVTPAAAPYLASLTQQGVTLDEMYAVDHLSLSNYIAMTSGNTPNASSADCSLPTADAWLAATVPAILASHDYRHRGALIITFDESEGADTRGCCGNATGGKIFTTVVSRAVVHPGTHTSVPYNHYSVLRTIEDAFGLDCLGHARNAATQPLGTDVWLVKNHHRRGQDDH